MGDFFRININPGFTDPWDAWMQNALVSGREMLGTGWSDCYMSAPIWRFTLAAGLIGTSAATGVMMPSVDRVGRQFPLVLVAGLPRISDPLAFHLNATGVFEQLESIALDALEDDATRETLTNALDQIAPPAELPGARVCSLPNALTVTIDTAQTLESALIQRLARTGLQRPSIWTAVLRSGTQMLATEGLPNADQIGGLFDPGSLVWSDPLGSEELV